MEDRKTLIADTAISVIANSGFRGLTHRAVDNAANLSTGSTSYYASSKAQLVALTVERLASLLRGYTEFVELSAARPDDPDALVEVLASWLEGLYANYRDELRARAAMMIDLDQSEGEDAALLQDALLTAADLEDPVRAAGLTDKAVPALLSALEGCLWEHAVGRQLGADSTSVDTVVLSGVVHLHDVHHADRRGLLRLRRH